MKLRIFFVCFALLITCSIAGQSYHSVYNKEITTIKVVDINNKTIYFPTPNTINVVLFFNPKYTIQRKQLTQISHGI